MHGETPAGEPMQVTEFHLRRQDFTDLPHLLAATDGLKVTTFRYATGVEALQLENRHGRIVLLPFMGQMIWSVEFNGVDLTMGSRFSMPDLPVQLLRHTDVLHSIAACCETAARRRRITMPAWRNALCRHGRLVSSLVTMRAVPMFG
nr:hypothetical protein [Agrobacterium salinitolerans]